MTIDERELFPERSAHDFFGAEMRHLRKRHDLSVGELAQLVRYSKTHVSNIETATRMPPPDLPGTLDAVLPSSGSFFSRLYPLVVEERNALSRSRSDAYLELEGLANTQHHYSMVTPGLWQTEEFGLAYLRNGMPTASEERIRELWQRRHRRKQIMSRANPPFIWQVLDELAIRRVVGGPGVMRRQIAQIIEYAERPNQLLQVLPIARANGAYGTNVLSVLHFDDAPRVAYLEGHHLYHLIEDPAEVANLSVVFDRTRIAALEPDDSLALLKKVMAEYRE
jgi:transcriptional regulator with XRE-family HTH domain